VIKEDGGASRGVPVWIRVFEGVGADGRAGWEAFFLLTKLRRFGRVTRGKEDTNSILLSYL